MLLTRVSTVVSTITTVPEAMKTSSPKLCNRRTESFVRSALSHVAGSDHDPLWIDVNEAAIARREKATRADAK